MDVKTLEDFIALAELRSFSNAARARHVTQPAFSRRIKALESWVGAELVDRSTFPARLTQAGSAFLETARETVGCLERGRTEARAAQPGFESQIRFAVPHSLAVSYFPCWWQAVSRKLGDVRVRALAGNYPDCVRSLLDGGCDFLLCYRYRPLPPAFNHEEYPGRQVHADRLVPVVAGDGNAERLRLPGSAGAPLPYLGYGSGAFFQSVIDDVVAARGGAHLRVRYENAFADALRAQAINGQGLAWLPQRLVGRELETGILALAGGDEWNAALEIWLYRAPEQRNDTTDLVWSAAGEVAGEGC